MDRLEDRNLRQCRQDQPRRVERADRGRARRPSDQGLIDRRLDPIYAASNAASAAFAMMTSSSILAPPAATASPATVIGKPPGTLVKSPMRTAMLNAFSSGA